MPKPRPLGVFVCDDHAAIRLGLKQILEEAGMRVIGAVGTVENCLEFADHKNISVYVVGLNIGETRGTALVELLRERNSEARIIVYGDYDSIPIISVAYEAGAKAFIDNSSDPSLLIEAVQAVAKDQLYFPPGLAEALAVFYISGARQEDPRNLLTNSELRIFVLLAEGHSVKEVAEMLGVTEKSIGNRAVTVRRKLRIPRDQFTTYALEHNLIERDQARVIRRTDRS